MRIGINALGSISRDTGGRTYLTNFVRTCVELQLPHKFFIFYSGPPEDLWGELPSNYLKIIVPWSGKSSWRKVLGEQVLLPVWIIGKKLDVMYFPGNFASLMVFKPKVVAVRNLLHYHYPEALAPFQRFYRKTLSWLTARVARSILVPSESMARDVIHLTGANPQKVTVVPHGVEIERFAQRAPESEIAARLEELGVSRPYFLFVSALWPYKGADRFVAALEQLRDRTGRQDLCGVFAGEGIGSDRYRKALEEQVRGKNLDKLVRFVGHRSHDDLAYLYWGAVALVFPSYCESFGNPLVEAMAAGTPVIASNRHATPETMGDGALIVDPDDTDAMAVAMERLLTDEKLRQRLVERDQKRVQDFNWARSVRSAMALLERKGQTKILMFGYLPPPVFGPSVAYQSLLRSKFSEQFDVTFINISVVDNISELEKVRATKFLKLAGFILRELFHLARKRFDFCCHSISYNRNAFLKDAALLGIARAFGVPTVLYAHGAGLPAFRQKLSPRLRRRFDAMVKNAAAAIVIAEGLRTDFEGLLPADRIFTVTIGIEPQAPLSVPPTKREAFTILYLGALYRLKGTFDLLEAMPHVLAQQPDARLLMAGDWFLAEEEQQARAFIHEHKLDSAVKFLGRITGEPKNTLLRSADVFVFPAHTQKEAFGIVLLEAMEAGLPIVTTRGGARSEIIADGVNGLLFEEKNPRDLAEQILKLAGDPALRARMGAANRSKFESSFTHEHYGRRMIRMFEALSEMRR